MAADEARSYYDQFAKQQQINAFNERHFLLAQRLKEWGLHPRASVLELGCGIGSVSKLILENIPHGSLTGVDFSETSVQLAKKSASRPNAEFITADLTRFSIQRKFDFITLFDVIEHIPVAFHQQVVELAASAMHEHSLFLVHFPNPDMTRFDRQHAPETLQHLDLEVEPAALIARADAARLKLLFFTIHSIWQKNDYCFFVFGRSSGFAPGAVKKSLAAKITARLRKWYVKR